MYLGKFQIYYERSEKYSRRPRKIPNIQGESTEIFCLIKSETKTRVLETSKKRKKETDKKYTSI